MRSVVTFVVLGGLLHAPFAHGQARPPDPVGPTELALWNAGLTATFALARAALEGNVRSVPEGLRVVGAGAVGGLGFFGAKHQIGQDRMTTGLALAFLSASVVENTTRGEHPLGVVRIGPGLFDLHVRTPWARGNPPAVRLEVDPLFAGALVATPFVGLQPERCGLKVCFRGPLRSDRPEVLGLALGRFVMLFGEPDLRVTTHELIHVVQTMQLSSVTPFGSSGTWGGTAEYGWLSVRTDWLFPVFGGLQHLQPYHRRWSEIEAHSLHWEAPTR